MAMKSYRNGNTQIFFKILTGPPNPSFTNKKAKSQVYNLGIAFRTSTAPVGYLPFYGVNDFDFSGETSLKEVLFSMLPINLSAAASPHSLLLKAAANDVEFLGSGEEDARDIQGLVKHDLLKHAMAAASGVFIDGVMTALGGPGINAVIQKLMKSKVKQFLVSKAISGQVKKMLKDQRNFDADKFLKNVP